MSPHGFHRLGDTLYLQISVRPKQGQQLTITGTASHLAGTLFNITFFCPSYALAMNYKKKAAKQKQCALAVFHRWDDE